MTYSHQWMSWYKIRLEGKSPWKPCWALAFLRLGQVWLLYHRLKLRFSLLKEAWSASRVNDLVNAPFEAKNCLGLLGYSDITKASLLCCVAYRSRLHWVDSDYLVLERRTVCFRHKFKHLLISILFDRVEILWDFHDIEIFWVLACEWNSFLG